MPEKPAPTLRRTTCYNRNGVGYSSCDQQLPSSSDSNSSENGGSSGENSGSNEENGGSGGKDDSNGDNRWKG